MLLPTFGFLAVLASIPLTLLVGAPMLLRRKPRPLIDEVYTDVYSRSRLGATGPDARSSGQRIRWARLGTSVQQAIERHSGTITREIKRAVSAMQESRDARSAASPSAEQSFDFVWSIVSSNGETPDSPIAGATVREDGVADEARGVDIEAIELLRAAGLHLDQTAVSPVLGSHYLVEGTASAQDLAEAIRDFVHAPTGALVIDANSSPLRLLEVAEVPGEILVIDRSNEDAQQVTPDPSTIVDLLTAHPPATEPRAAR